MAPCLLMRLKLRFAEANNITLIGGSSQTVGPAGGWILGGGHSALSPTLGLGVDRVVCVLPTLLS